MLFAFAVTTAFMPGLTGGALPTGWVVLWLVMPFLLIEHRNFVMTPAHWWGLAFLAYAGVSLIWSPNGLLRFMQLAILGAVFIWASDLKDIRRVLKGVALGLGVSGLVTLSQLAGYHSVQVAPGSDYAGLFYNRNVLAEVSAVLAVALVAYRLPYWWLIVTLPGLLMSSRTVLLALFACGLVVIWRSNKILATVVAGIEASAIGFLVWANPQSTGERWDLWRDTWQGLTWWGHGVGSFEYLFPAFASHIDTFARRPQHAHNDLLELMFELGVGVIPLVLMVLSLLRLNDVGKFAIMCFLVIGLASFPLSTPVTAFVAVVVAGSVSRRFAVVRFDGAGWRPAVPLRVSSC